MVREVRGVEWVREYEGRPGCIPAPKALQGAKREGMKFEEDLLAVLPGGTRRGVWLEFRDVEGRGFAQVDFLIPAGGDHVVVGEAKLTWRVGAYLQLRRLYLPLLAKLYGKRVLGALILCKNLTWETPRREVAEDLVEALRWMRGRGGFIPVVHVATKVARSAGVDKKGGYVAAV